MLRFDSENRRSSFVACGLAAVLLLGCTTANVARDREVVEIRRTAHGVVHVVAGDYQALGYGIAYAYAQDNACLTADQLVTARGERSKFFGGQRTTRLGVRVYANEQLDVFVKAHMDDEALAAAHARASEAARALARGYVAGHNRYLEENASALPVGCRSAPWVKPMTLAELYRMQELVMIQAGIGLFADAWIGAAPPRRGTPLASTTDTTLPRAADVAAIANFPEGANLGSNGWAFGRDATVDGRGLLVGNPHFPWDGASRFWQMHLTIPGSLDVMGAAIAHFPVVQVGFNRDIAWTHTVSTARRFTIHELSLDQADPTSYIVDGRKKTMRSKTVEVEVSLADGTVATRRWTVWISDWGPIIAVPPAQLAWSARHAYALNDANASNARSVDVWLGLAHAADVGSVRTALAALGLPWVNTLAADRSGNALYADLSAVPNVSLQLFRECSASDAARVAVQGFGFPVLDGSVSRCAWRHDTESAVPGLMPPSQLPVAVRTDWVQNANDSYWLTHPSAPLAALSPILGRTGTPQGLRTRNGVRAIDRRLAGQDGLAGKKMGLAEAKTILFENRNFAAALVADDLRRVCATPRTDESRSACGVLATWDGKDDVDSRGAPLFREFWRRASVIQGVWQQPFTVSAPIDTPSGLRVDDPTVAAAVLDSLHQAVLALRAAGHQPDATLGSLQAKVTPQGRVPLHGGAEIEGVLNKVDSASGAALSPDGYSLDSGTSYVQVVGFDQRGPLADAILVYGQSSDPQSPVAFDQWPMFSRKQWLRLPFDRADVEAQTVGTVLRLPAAGITPR